MTAWVLKSDSQRPLFQRHQAHARERLVICMPWATCWRPRFC